MVVARPAVRVRSSRFGFADGAAASELPPLWLESAACQNESLFVTSIAQVDFVDVEGRNLS